MGSGLNLSSLLVGRYLGDTLWVPYSNIHSYFGLGAEAFFKAKNPIELWEPSWVSVRLLVGSRRVCVINRRFFSCLIVGAGSPRDNACLYYGYEKSRSTLSGTAPTLTYLTVSKLGRIETMERLVLGTAIRLLSDR